MHAHRSKTWPYMYEETRQARWYSKKIPVKMYKIRCRNEEYLNMQTQQQQNSSIFKLTEEILHLDKIVSQNDIERKSTTNALEGKSTTVKGSTTNILWYQECSNHENVLLHHQHMVLNALRLQHSIFINFQKCMAWINHAQWYKCPLKQAMVHENCHSPFACLSFRTCPMHISMVKYGQKC